MNDIRIEIEGSEPKPAKGNTDPRVTAAELQRDRALSQAQQAHNSALQSKYEALDAQRVAIESEAKAGELEYQRAYEMGDGDGMAAAQRKMARAEVRALNVDEARANLVEAARNTQQVAVDPVEAAARSCSPKSAEWVRRHPDLVRDDLKRAKLTSAHYSAVAEGHAPDSEQYFRFIERSMGLKQPKQSKPEESGEPAVRLEDGTTVLDFRPGEPLPQGTVRMTRREYEAATEVLKWERGPKRGMPIGVREYLRRRGLMDNAPQWQRLDD